MARKRQLASLKAGSRGAPIAPSVSSEDNGGEHGRVDELLAEKAGVSPTTYFRAKTILEKAPEEVKEKVRSGEMSIHEGYKRTRPPRQQGSRPRDIKNFIVIEAAQFDFVSAAIDQAHNEGQPSITLKHDGHRIIDPSTIELAT